MGCRITDQYQILDEKDPKGCIPLYIRPDDPLCPPLLSHNSQTRNVLLKITVPRRTGRKRKRGSDGPYLEESKLENFDGNTKSYSRGLALAATGMEESRDTLYAKRIRSQRRLDHHREILRSLQDNINSYTVRDFALLSSPIAALIMRYADGGRRRYTIHSSFQR